MSIQEIEQAILNLSPEDLDVFSAWFAEYDAERWDRQFSSDASNGRLDRFIKTTPVFPDIDSCPKAP
jgi:hypothetical protein